MVERNEGLTKIHNRFHDPDERSNAIGELPRLRDTMDRAVLDAYGWSDLRPVCAFELEWQDDEAANGGRPRKPWRYRWPEPVRDEALARLLALNTQRAGEARRKRWMRPEKTAPMTTAHRSGDLRARAFCPPRWVSPCSSNRAPRPFV